MLSKNGKAAKVEKTGGAEPFGIAVNEAEKSKFNITLPLSYDFEFSPVDDKGESVPVSSIVFLGTKTIIKTSGSTSQWKLRVMNPVDLSDSNMDPTGNTQTAGDDECGDRFDDWLKGKAKGMDEKTRTLVQGAQREIIFQKEGS